MGHQEDNGYAKLTVYLGGKDPKTRRKSIWVHRLAYIILCNAPIPEGYDVDHKCKFTLCINPNHLQAIPLAANRNTYKKANPGRQMSLANFA
jgi:hypothetical protein